MGLSVYIPCFRIQLQNCHLFSNFVSFFLIFVQEVVETVKQNESKMAFLFRKKKAYAPTMQNSFTLSFQSQAIYGKFVDFNNNYLKSNTNGDLWLHEYLKQFYVVTVWSLNSFIIVCEDMQWKRTIPIQTSRTFN